jgi:hypothetical protein
MLMEKPPMSMARAVEVNDRATHDLARYSHELRDAQILATPRFSA